MSENTIYMVNIY